MRRDERLRYVVHDILFREWDPIGVNDNERISDEYDSYVPTIALMLDEGADARHLADHLSNLRRIAMGMSHTDADTDLHIAQRLIAARPHAVRPCAVKSFNELFRRYAEGYRDFTGSDIDFNRDDSCNGKRLDGAILDDSWFSCSFVGASLRGCSFRRSNVKASDFSNADLRGADFRGAALCGTTFIGAKMDGVRIAGAYYHSAEFKEGEVPNW
ncbi:MAG: pentapeptide repeat-containing protein [Planctomyces sp.]|nr:pentapeptide repeat-containing protein [Planctomyces sp.]